MSRDRVLESALALADAEGLQAVTMRRLGDELGVEAMSLYYHLPGKDGLLDGLVDTLAGQIEYEIEHAVASRAGGNSDTALTAEQDWRAVLRRRCLAARRVMVRHPWGPGLLASRKAVPFSVYLLFEGTLATMVRGGLSYHLGHQALHALGSMVLGFAQEIFSPAQAAGDVDPDAADAEFEAVATALPYLAAMVAVEMHDNDDPVLGWCDSQTEFEFTLDLLLDGLERKRLTGS